MYYGTYQRFTNNTYNKKAVFVIPEKGIGMAEFSLMDEGQRFITYHMEVTHLINYLCEVWQQTNEPVKSWEMPSWPSGFP